MNKLKKSLGIEVEETPMPQNGKYQPPQTPETSGEDIDREYRANLKTLKTKQKTIKFPIDAFPPRTRDILKCFALCDGFPIEFYGINALTAVASLLGVAFKARYRQGHEHFPILYSILVGDSSAGKSMSMKPVFSPIYKFEKDYNDAHIAALENWRNDCFEAKMTDAKAKLPDEPVQHEIVMDNATLEALVKTMYRNPRGLLYMQEEVLAWIKNMNAYRSGSDEQFWLKDWDAAFVKITRNGAETMTIRNPNATVVGGIQPALVHQLLSDGKGGSGFSARLLFAYPEDTIAPYDSDSYPSSPVTEAWYNILKFIHKLPNRILPPKTIIEKPIVEACTIDCTDAAKAVYKAYFNKLTDESNAADDDRIKSLLGKLKSYTMRFSLILEMLKVAESQLSPPQTEPKPTQKDDVWDKGEDTPSVSFAKWEDLEANIKISEDSMKSAVKFTEYFKMTGIKVLDRLETPVDALKAEQQAWYRALPMGGLSFTNSVKSAEKAGFSKATANRLLNNPILFKKVGDVYERRIA